VLLIFFFLEDDITPHFYVLYILYLTAIPESDVRTMRYPAAINLPNNQPMNVDFAGHILHLLENVTGDAVTTFSDVSTALGDAGVVFSLPRVFRELAQPPLSPPPNVEEGWPECKESFYRRIKNVVFRVVRSTGALFHPEQAVFLEKNGVPLIPLDPGPEKERGKGGEGGELLNVAVDMARARVVSVPETALLARLAEEQKQMSKKVVLASSTDAGSVRFVGGVDVSYMELGCGRALGFGAFVLYDLKRDEVVQRWTNILPVLFPYIPTYLAYREMPVVLDLLGKTRDRWAGEMDVLFVNGHGIMHPRGLGLASHLGVLLDVPTVGVAKKALRGAEMPVGDLVPVRYGKKIVGFHVSISGGEGEKRRRRGLVITPGHRVSIADSLRISRQALRDGKIVPLVLAHRLARKEYLSTKTETGYLSR